MTQYHMTKKERQLKRAAEVWAVIERGRFATLALCRDGEPYLVTMNYGLDSATRSLYLHGAPSGLKLAFIHSNPRVCGTVVEDHGYLMERCSHAYVSAVFWGRIRIVSDAEEKRHGLEVLIDHLEQDPVAVKGRLLSGGDWIKGVTVLCLDVASITGKQNTT